jgi:hypothetical protein
MRIGLWSFVMRLFRMVQALVPAAGTNGNRKRAARLRTARSSARCGSALFGSSFGCGCLFGGLLGGCVASLLLGGDALLGLLARLCLGRVVAGFALGQAGLVEEAGRTRSVGRAPFASQCLTRSSVELHALAFLGQHRVPGTQPVSMKRPSRGLRASAMTMW